MASVNTQYLDEQQEKDIKRFSRANDSGSFAQGVGSVFLDLTLKGVDQLRPFAPSLIPLVVCLCLLPIVALLSLSAGWSVWRSTAVAWQSSLDLQYGDGGPPYAEVALTNLVAQQPYDISLHLVLPAIEQNFALGNFMTTLTLYSTPNKTLISVRRPAIAAPRPSSVFSRSTPVVDLRIMLLTGYAPGRSNILAKVELGRRDGWRSIGSGEGRELAVMEAFLQGAVRHQGLRGLITRFPLLAAISSTSIFFLISLLMLTACILPTMQGLPTASGGADEPISEPEKEPEVPLKKRRSSTRLGSTSGERVRRRSTSGSSRRRSQDIKTEDEASFTIVPPSGLGPRKRRSFRNERFGAFGGSSDS